MAERHTAGPALPHPLEVKWREPETGFWFLYPRRAARLVPARIFWCDFEPGNEENKMDRSFLAGQIAERWVDPIQDIWMRVLLLEANPGHWSCAQPMIPQEGLTPSEEFSYQLALLDHARARGAMPMKPIAKLRHLELPF